ncbi:hypothetical protein [Rhodococcus sp. LW-XY12]|uniref:hypothetical protein n=1 Tax=Rhodococcus sp. LW-XY12 TaxID=2856851 RepID=UPI001C590C25|nr:hypothetical protein [Rhodococcus sp. LW-XY12]QXU53625.1 hypothetical protein KXC42_23355 [Rhodococcus sp. LW-XY12]
MSSSTTARGLGWDHQKTRERLLRNHVDGTPCWWCSLPMFRNRTNNWDHDPTSNDPASGSLAADHSQARAHGGTQADRLLHGTCNKERQDGRRDHLRPAVTGHRIGAEESEEPLGIRLLPWP